MMRMEGILAESSGVRLLVFARTEVMLENSVCNGHILNRWHMQIWFAVLCYRNYVK